MSAEAAKKGLIGVQQRLVALLAVVGGIILVSGISLTVRELWFQMRAVKTMGTWTDSSGMMEPGTNVPNILYLVRFTTGTGKVVNFYEMRRGEELPDKVPLAVFYDPQNPQNARMLTSGRWTLPLQLLLAGICFGTLGAGVRFLGNRPKPTPETGNPVTPLA